MLSLPVAGSTESSQLFNDTSAELLFPCPCSLHELVTSEVSLCDTLLTHSLNYLGFGCDSSVVGAGYPQSSIALHSLETGEYILHGVVNSVTHMQLTCYVRGRHSYGIGLFLGVGNAAEAACFLPCLICTALNFARVVGL